VTRLYRWTAVASPPIAASLVLLAQSMTPGYDPLRRTVSRLATPGMPAAELVGIAMVLVALACFALALRLESGRGSARAVLAVAGLAFLVAAAIHLDPASGSATSAHRVASGIAVLGLTVAPLALARDYGAIFLVAGAAEVAMLAVAALLLATPFAAWGAWERALLATALTWMVLIALRSVSADATNSVPNAITRNRASAAPEASVSSANP
jgi:uncharacterized protein DUF998